jgi:integrase
MAIRQRHWRAKGKTQSAWVHFYRDLKGKRRQQTFKTKKAAEAARATTLIELSRGLHVANSDSITVAEAGSLWVAAGESDGLVRSSAKQRREHLKLHLEPFIGAVKLSQLSVPTVRAFQDRLLEAGRSPALVKKVLSSLGSVITDAQERGLAMHNPVRERKKRRKKTSSERKRRLTVGEDIPTPAEIRAILHAATGYRRAFFAMAALAGLRASELRGLRWEDVDLGRAAVTVRQRADAWGDIDVPKSEAGERTVPLPSLVVNGLKEWRLACPRRPTARKDQDGELVRELHYVFPNGRGSVESHSNIVQRQWHPLQLAAGVAVPALDDEGRPVLDEGGKPMMCAKYSGLHCLRHFFATWCAARPQDGGLGLPLKTVQVRMGHSSLVMTADRYGHLFPSQDDAEVLSAGERALMGS